MEITRKARFCPIVLTLEKVEEAKIMWLMLDYFDRSLDEGMRNKHINGDECQILTPIAEKMRGQFHEWFPRERGDK